MAKKWADIEMDLWVAEWNQQVAHIVAPSWYEARAALQKECDWPANVEVKRVAYPKIIGRNETIIWKDSCFQEARNADCEALRWLPDTRQWEPMALQGRHSNEGVDD